MILQYKNTTVYHGTITGTTLSHIHVLYDRNMKALAGVKTAGETSQN